LAGNIKTYWSTEFPNSELTVIVAYDVDGDGIPDDADNCADAYNPEQLDSDGDGYGDLCDPCQFDPNNDADMDGFCGNADCDDNDPSIYPGAIEICDGLDNDCDGLVDSNDDDFFAPSSTVSVPVISGLPDPTPLHEEIQLSASSSNLNIQSTSWDWGDGNHTDGSVDVGPSGSEIIGVYSYNEVGVYEVELTTTGGDCGAESISVNYGYMVVYDPSGAFVTGGGWIDSPTGAYRADPLLEGKANFGFVSKYKKGTSIPTGKTEFQFKAGDLNFNSYEYSWLVIAGHRAMFKGKGTINGEGEYGFLLTAVDGDLKTNGGNDMFRIKIWVGEDDQNVIYDNEFFEESVDADPKTAIGGGSIAIHAKNNLKSASIIDPEAKISIYPNPFNNFINIELNSEKTHEIIIDLIDMNGRTIEKMFTGIISAELDHQFEFNTKADLTPGSYMLRIRTENGEILSRDIIIKR
jgi:hypothetical protein